MTRRLHQLLALAVTLSGFSLQACTAADGASSATGVTFAASSEDYYEDNAAAANALEMASENRASESAAGEEEFAGNDSVSDEDLDKSRGAFNPSVLNLSQLDAVSQGNTVNGGVTGNNQIDTNAFSDTSGLVNVIQNSGNNNLIQSSTVVNINFVQ